MHHHDATHQQERIARLRHYDRVFEPLHRQMMGWLKIAPGSRVLDAGCGGGGVTRLLAEAVGEGGHVTALDIEPELLTAAQELLAATPYTIVYQEGSLDALPFEDAQFDLAWCSRVVHHTRDQLTAARELRRVLKPGGRLALREDGHLMQLLPFDTGLGQAGLDERLIAVSAREFAQVRPSIPDAVPYPFGWTHLLREAGFAHVTARSFIFEALQPFGDDLSEYVIRHWRYPLEDAESSAHLSPQDRDVLAQLVDPNSPHFLLKRDDLYFVKVSTVYVGQR